MRSLTNGLAPSIKDRDKNRDKARRSPARINNLLQRGIQEPFPKLTTKTYIDIAYGTPKWNDRHQYIQRKLRNLEDKYAGIITAESMSPSSMEDDSDEDESDDSDSDDERNLQDINPLPLVRPSDPVEAVKYDVIKAVWAKHSLGLSGTIIRTALGNYSDILNVIRNQWKAAQAALAETEKSTNQAGITEAKTRLDQLRETMKAAATTTLEHGHQDILEKYVAFFFFPSPLSVPFSVPQRYPQSKATIRPPTATSSIFSVVAKEVKDLTGSESVPMLLYYAVVVPIASGMLSFLWL